MQFLDQLYFENFKAARDEEDRLAKEATARARKVPPPPPLCTPHPMPMPMPMHMRMHGLLRMHYNCEPRDLFADCALCLNLLPWHIATVIERLAVAACITVHH